MSAPKKQPRQRATIILTASKTSETGFDLDCVFEPSIKGRDTTGDVVVDAARQVNAFILNRFSKGRIIVP